jgi:hypothetical protein
MSFRSLVFAIAFALPTATLAQSTLSPRYNGVTANTGTFNRVTINGAGSTGDASGLSVTATGGSTSRTLANIVGDVVDLRDKGALCDGVHDDRPALVAALSTGRAVFVPETQTSCLIGPPRVPLPSGTKIIGRGFRSKLTIDPTTLEPLFEAVNQDGIYIEGVNLEGNQQTQTSAASGSAALSATNSTNIKVKNSFLRYWTRHALYIDGSSNIEISDNEIFQTHNGAGVLVGATQVNTDVQVIRNHIKNTQMAQVHSYTGNRRWVIANNILDGSGMGSGSMLDGEIADNITAYVAEHGNQDVTISGNTLLNSKNNGIHLGGDRISIIGNTVIDPYQSGIFLANGGATTDRSYGATIAGNNVEWSDAMKAARIAAGGTVRAIVVRNLRGGTVTGNVVRNAYDGLEINGSDIMENLSVTGNSIQASHFNIWFRNTMTNVLLNGNVLDGLGSSEVYRTDILGNITSITFGIDRIINGVNEKSHLFTYIDSGGNASLGVSSSLTTADINLVPKGNGRVRFSAGLAIPFGTPSSATAFCKQGELKMDDTYIYSCVADNSWHRASNGAAW